MLENITWWSYENEDFCRLPSEQDPNHFAKKIFNTEYFKDGQEYSGLFLGNQKLQKTHDSETKSRIAAITHFRSTIAQLMPLEAYSFGRPAIAAIKMVTIAFATIFTVLFAYGLLAFISNAYSANYALFNTYRGPFYQYINTPASLLEISKKIPEFTNELINIKIDTIDLVSERKVSLLIDKALSDDVSKQNINIGNTRLRQTQPPPQSPFQIEIIKYKGDLGNPSKDEMKKFLLAFSVFYILSHNPDALQQFNSKSHLIISLWDNLGEVASQAILVFMLFTMLHIFFSRKNILYEGCRYEEDYRKKEKILSFYEHYMQRNYQFRKGFHHLLAGIVALIFMSLQVIFLTHWTNLPSLNPIEINTFTQFDYRLNVLQSAPLFCFFWIIKFIVIYLIFLTAWELHQMQKCISASIAFMLPLYDENGAIRKKIKVNPTHKTYWSKIDRLCKSELTKTASFSRFRERIEQDRTTLAATFLIFIISQMACSYFKSTPIKITNMDLTNMDNLKHVYNISPLILTALVLSFINHSGHPFLRVTGIIFKTYDPIQNLDRNIPSEVLLLMGFYKEEEDEKEEDGDEDKG